MSSTPSPQIPHTFLLRPRETAVSFCVEIRTNEENATELNMNQPNGGEAHHVQPYWSLDLILYPVSPAEFSLEARDDGRFSHHLYLKPSNSPPLLFLNECVDSIPGVSFPASEIQEPTALRFIFSTKSGQVARCDFLQRRLECCELVVKAASFSSPLQSVAGLAPRQVTSACLFDVLAAAIGGVRIQDFGLSDPAATLQELNRELRNRLSFPWLLTDAVPRRRVAWVQGREDIESSRRAYEAAWALGISIVMIDHAGHWLHEDDGPYAHLREAFIPVNIDVDVGFTQRVVGAVRAYPQAIDGLMTISDVRLPGVAKACEILGLPTSPYDAYATAGDKAKTRMLEADGDESFTLSSAEEWQGYLSDCQNRPLRFPLIVKPCLGWNSDCVSKVSNEAELAEAVRKASDRHSNATTRSTSVVVEPYIDGPEVDANFVLLDGEILFSDISDDFPSRGDAADAGPTDNFQETQNLFPTALPEREVAALQDSLHKSILRQGFSSGIFHCEARVRYSRVHYTVQDGIVDLEEKTEPPSHDFSIYLLEINARPPGYLETVAVQLGYGVDYYALRLLFCIGLGEVTRIRFLAQPFINSPQFTLSLMIVPQTRVGVMKTADAGAEFLNRHPQLRGQIPDYKTQKKGGDVLEGQSASSLWWIAHFSVFSRVGRRDCLQLVQFIQDHFWYEVE